jgi:DNA-binding response OmpR family regulator
MGDAEDPAVGSEARVLVVDDEPDLLELLRLDLELAGYRVEVARDGVEALEQLRQDPSDVVLLDVMMPRMDGWQVLAAMRSDERLADIPVVMLTALAGEVDQIRGHLSGAVRYVTKPFELSALLEAVDGVLHPQTEPTREERRSQVTSMLQRLAELEAGRERPDISVRLSRLEATRPSPAAQRHVDEAVLAALTPRQRQVAAMLAAGASARAIASHLGTSRANVYATRKRIARSFGVPAAEVAEVAAASGLAREAPTTEQDGPPDGERQPDGASG